MDWNETAQDRRVPLPVSGLLMLSALGRSQATRQGAYKALFKARLEEGRLEEIRSAWETGTPLEENRFKEQIERALGQRVGYSKRGRSLKREPVRKGL